MSVVLDHLPDDVADKADTLEVTGAFEAAAHEHRRAAALYAYHGDRGAFEHETQAAVRCSRAADTRPL
jgi:hypothetical protein